MNKITGMLYTWIQNVAKSRPGIQNAVSVAIGKNRYNADICSILRRKRSSANSETFPMRRFCHGSTKFWIHDCDEKAASERFLSPPNLVSATFQTWFPHCGDFSISWLKPHFESLGRYQVISQLRIGTHTWQAIQNTVSELLKHQTELQEDEDDLMRKTPTNTGKEKKLKKKILNQPILVQWPGNYIRDT